LKQSSRIWNRRLHNYLKKIGFKQLESDHCVYINYTSGIILAIWVDDLIIFSKDMATMDEIKRQMRQEFEMKDQGELRYFLGILVERDRARRTIRIDQKGYIDMILKRFNMENSNPVSTPIATGTKLIKATADDEIIETKGYQSLVGSQMYAMLCTRADLAFAISQISQFGAAPTSTHESVAKRVMRYLNGTSDLGITFDGKVGGNAEGANLVLEGYSDADFAAGEDRKSISGYVFTLANGAVSWSSKKQATVALSTTEAEYIALVQATKESIWIQRLLGELGRQATGAQTLYGDNQGAIALASNPEYHARTKHIDIQYHFIRECVENGVIKLQYCPTEDMVADGMTKALPKERHWKLARKMGMGMSEETTSPSPT